MINPPVIDERSGERASALGEAARVVADLVNSGARTICFIKSRKAVEVLTRSCASGSTASWPSRDSLSARDIPPSSGASSSSTDRRRTCSR